MATAKNRVIAGDYEKKIVVCSWGMAKIKLSLTESLDLDKYSVDSYEVVNDERHISGTSSAARSLLGGALLGSAGAFAGGISAKTKGIYTIAVYFKDGKRSLMEVDDNIYKAIIKQCF